MSDSTVKRMRSLRRIGLVVAVLAAGGLAWWAAGEDESAAGAPPFSPWTGAVPVRTVQSEAGVLEVSLQAVGDVTPLAAVTVIARVGGPLQRLLFVDGATVEAGAALAEIDSAPYRAKLAQAQGEHSQVMARLRHAERELTRSKALLREDAIERQVVEAAESNIAELRAAVSTAEARVADARLQLDWTRITAPIAGRLGLRGLDAGNLVVAGSTELVTIVQMKPIGVTFGVPGHELPAVRAAMRDGRTLAVDVYARDGSSLLARGVLATLDNRIDPRTGTVRLRAEFANEDEALFPNQFVNVRLRVGVDREAVTIPADAVQYGARGAYVYVIEDNRARLRPVETGRVADGLVAIVDGLAADEMVVLEGVDRLREGREVSLQGEVALSAPK